MTKINIHEAKTHLSRYAARVKAGETVVLCDRNVPFAEIRPLLAPLTSKKRAFGLYRGQIKVKAGFDKADKQIIDALTEPVYPKQP